MEGAGPVAAELLLIFGSVALAARAPRSISGGAGAAF